MTKLKVQGKSEKVKLLGR